MKPQSLYILAFKDEPLIKVGLALDTHLRVIGLGYDRFDFAESYIVTSKDQACIRTLERNLKTFFAAHQVKSQSPLRSGNTETFALSSLPGILQSIETFRDNFPHAGFRIERDFSSVISAPRPPRLPPKRCEPQVETPLVNKLLAELKAYCDQERGRRSRFAELLGEGRAALSEWFAPPTENRPRPRRPTAEQALAIQAFLRAQRRRRPPPSS